MNSITIELHGSGNMWYVDCPWIGNDDCQGAYSGESPGKVLSMVSTHMVNFHESGHNKKK